MRFEVGQVYESIDGQHQAVVAEIRNDGREGLLRVNGGREEWFLWAELHQAGQWRLIASVRAPEAFGEPLAALPPRIAAHVPDDILEIWFPPGAAAGVMSSRALSAAKDYAANFGCGFSYLPERREGVFHKLPPNEIRTTANSY